MKSILIIAGSDSGGGAGIQADIKASQFHKVFVTTAITAITAQNTQGVQGVVALEPSFVQLQIKSILDDFEISAIKIGMLGNCELINAVYESLKHIDIPIILDPVAISRAGAKLIEDEAIESLKKLFPIATLITPNSHEAKLFFNVEKEEDISTVNNYGTNILFKNLNKYEDKTIDVLINKNKEIKKFTSLKANSSNTHGTGCSFSSSIASLIARDFTLEDSIEVSKNYIYKAIKSAPNLGKGNGPINHILVD
ncbi:hydroxymethylpyrimidine/phosphomethylpyrimidine kinase [Malaciobacter pacificus]|uniref:hydroxymethylpyrimidine kinase n=1 Tax=Malaciobacter pacificus TaxID=1080223 RepID=A0A5C2H5S4_9BACT|nr:bifunctional hydroxymethylpyrimidine kinase/phosphomethylpyrimidine kinase [Malaciobacter pacificus]QEP34320.1 hydroxymethylpyrimidine kinase / phosphohydroxymethylpyrimidine kinase [Malaciobacter pacificus]GGD48035.1 hydroxymethylpyrimidine/phosphomethylpyrimidine kinase [Malaciobacter pacificus]